MDPEKVLVTEGRSGMEKNERISTNYEQFPPFNYGSPFINLFQAAAVSASNLHHFLSPSLTNLSPQVTQNLFRNVINNNTDPAENNKDNNNEDHILLKPDQAILNESMKRILEVVENSKQSHSERTSPNDKPSLNGFTNSDLSIFSCIKTESERKGHERLECTFCSLVFNNVQEFDSHRISCEARKVLKRSRFDVPQSIRDSIMSASTLRLRGESDEDESQRGSSFEDDSGLSDHKRARVRSVLSEETLQVLRAQYDTNPRPKKYDIQRLSQQLNYSTRVIQVWFQNMRARDRRMGKPIPNGGGHDANSSDVPESVRSLGDRSPLMIGNSLLPFVTNTTMEPSSKFGHSEASKTRSKFHVSSLSPSPAITPIPCNKNHYSNKCIEKITSCVEQPLDLSVRLPTQSNHDSINLSLQAIICQSDAARAGNMSKDSNNGSMSEDGESMSRGASSLTESIVVENVEYLSDSSKVRNSPPTSGKIWKIVDEVNHDSSLRGSLSPCREGSGSPGGEMTGIFVCDHCDKSFNKQSSLARHKYEHSGN